MALLKALIKNMKMLLFLNSEKKLHRVIRRAIVVGVLSAIAVVLTALVDIAPIYTVPVITALLAAIDKITRK